MFIFGTHIPLIEHQKVLEIHLKISLLIHGLQMKYSKNTLNIQGHIAQTSCICIVVRITKNTQDTLGKYAIQQDLST